MLARTKHVYYLIGTTHEIAALILPLNAAKNTAWHDTLAYSSQNDTSVMNRKWLVLRQNYLYVQISAAQFAHLTVCHYVLLITAQFQAAL